MNFERQLLISFIILIPLINCNIIIKRTLTDQTVEQFYDLPAQFGPNIPSNGITLFAMKADPLDGCKTQHPPPIDNDPIGRTRKYVLIIARNNCTFEEKVRFAQNASYQAAIVFNIGSDELEQMSAKSGFNIDIPSVFVGETTGRYIIEGYLEENEFFLILNDELPFNINTHLILPFSILVGLCFIIMVTYMVYKCIRERRRQRQHRLPKRLLKKIPVIKFTEGVPYDSCVICLEDYTKGERLRILPCHHVYHCHCIDTWLTKNRRVCPICKRKVFGRVPHAPSRRRNSSSESDTDDDTQPLIQSENNNSNNHGTFNAREESSAPPLVEEARTAEQQAVLSTDDESILVNPSRRQRNRVNPFDRQQNITGNVANTLNSQTPSFWNSRIFRFFRRGSTNPSSGERRNINSEMVPSAVDTSIQMPRSVSNNILNSYWGFENDDDESIINIQSIYEPINTSAVGITPENGNNVSQNEDVFISTLLQGGLAVAALPNTNLNGRNSSSRNFII